MEDVAEIADRVIVMNDGRIEADGSVAEVFSKDERLLKIGLDVPQITRLVKKLRSLRYDIPEDIYTVQSAAAAIKRIVKGDANA